MLFFQCFQVSTVSVNVRNCTDHLVVPAHLALLAKDVDTQAVFIHMRKIANFSHMGDGQASTARLTPLSEPSQSVRTCDAGSPCFKGRKWLNW